MIASFFRQGRFLPRRGAGLTSWQRSSAYACLIAGPLLVVVASAFAVANFRQHHGPLVAFNLFAVLCGLAGLAALARGRITLAMAFLFGGNALYSFGVSYFMGSGLDICFLLFGLTGTHVVRSPALRRAILAVVCVGFFAIAARRLDPSFHAAVPAGRILLNTGLGLFLLALFDEVFQRQAEAYRREIEEKNRRLREANEAKEKLFSILSHDLCGPIGSLKEALAYLGDGRLSPEEFGRVRGMLEEDVDQAFSTARSLLEWSATQMDALVPVPAPVPLAAACGAAIALHRPASERKRIAVENRIGADVVAWADAEQVRTLFRNLLSNALKFTPSGGAVVIEAREGAEGFWRVTVRDSGIGMAAEKASRLFEPGFRETTPGLLEEKGLGLGLAICRGFVHAHGGTLRAESLPGEGTAVHFTLPRESGPTA